MKDKEKEKNQESKKGNQWEQMKKKDILLQHKEIWPWIKVEMVISCVWIIGRNRVLIHKYSICKSRRGCYKQKDPNIFVIPKYI